MNSYASLRKKNSGTLFSAIALALCVAVSAAVLFSRIVPFAPTQQQQMIPLTQSNGITTVTAQNMGESGGQPVRSTHRSRAVAAATPASAILGLLDEPTANPGFQIFDKDTVWSGTTDVQIFSMSYDNESGEMTVHSASGDKILAPGTENTYNFTLQNTGDVPLEYTLTLEAYFSDGEHTIPVVARLQDYKGNYLLGSEDAYADVLKLNGAGDHGTLSAGYLAPYTLQWQWPFEGDDAYDTLLGNLATQEDISLTIVIRTVASYNGEGGGKPPQTGDQSQITLAATVMVVSMAGLVAILLLPKRRREEKAHE